MREHAAEFVGDYAMAERALQSRRTFKNRIVYEPGARGSREREMHEETVAMMAAVAPKKRATKGKMKGRDTSLF